MSRREDLSIKAFVQGFYDEFSAHESGIRFKIWLLFQRVGKNTEVVSLEYRAKLPNENPNALFSTKK